MKDFIIAPNELCSALACTAPFERPIRPLFRQHFFDYNNVHKVISVPVLTPSYWISNAAASYKYAHTRRNGADNWQSRKDSGSNKARVGLWVRHKQCESESSARRSSSRHSYKKESNATDSKQCVCNILLLNLIHFRAIHRFTLCQYRGGRGWWWNTAASPEWFFFLSLIHPHRLPQSLSQQTAEPSRKYQVVNILPSQCTKQKNNIFSRLPL